MVELDGWMAFSDSRWLSVSLSKGDNGLPPKSPQYESQSESIWFNKLKWPYKVKGMLMTHPPNLPDTSLGLSPQRTTLCPAHSGQAERKTIFNILFRKSSSNKHNLCVIQVLPRRSLCLCLCFPLHCLQIFFSFYSYFIYFYLCVVCVFFNLIVLPLHSF